MPHGSKKSVSKRRASRALTLANATPGAQVANVNGSGQSTFSAELIRSARRARFSPIRSITPETLSQYLEGWAAGSLSQFALAAQAIKKRDDVISVALPKREKAVSRRDYAIHVNDGIGEDSPLKAQADKHRDALKFFYDNLTAVNVMDQNERGGFRRLVRQMMDAVGFKYACHEIVWQPRIVEGAPRLTALFNYAPLQFFENSTGKLRFLRNYYGGSEGEEMPDDRWLVTVGDGIMEALSVAWMLKQLSLKDWACFNELLGTPIRLGFTSAAKDSPGWNALVEALEGIGQDFAAVLSEGSKIEFPSVNKTGGETFGPFVDRMDRAMARICRGADLSTMSAGNGSGQGASLQGDESDLLEEDDAEMISEALIPVSRIVVRDLFGDDTPLAYLQVVVPEAQNNDDVRKTIETLGARGVAIGQSWARLKLDVPEPAKGEALLTVPAAPAASAMGRNSFGQEMTAAFANAAEAAVRSAAFRTRSLKEIAVAKAKAFEPLRARIEEIATIAKPEAFDAALVKLKADLPAIAKAVAGTDAEVEAWVNAMGTQLVSGAAEAAKDKALPGLRA
jgi:phage gp29-like protein